MPICGEALARSEGFAALSRALSSTRFAGKIAWSMMARRRGKLHATVAESLSADEVERLNAAELRDAMAALGPAEVELRGLFSGRINLGRLYLKAYPRRCGDTNLFAAVQRTLGRATTDLYPVGLLNLDDQLGPEEADELHALIALWWDRAVLRVAASHLVLMRSWDDLTLDAQTIGDVPLLR